MTGPEVEREREHTRWGCNQKETHHQLNCLFNCLQSECAGPDLIVMEESQLQQQEQEI